MSRASLCSPLLCFALGAQGAPAAKPEPADRQRASLDHIYYEVTPRPTPPSAGELGAVKEALRDGRIPAYEREVLTSVFGSTVELMAYARRDLDGDRILDYRVGQYHGKFFEGDPDVDGDGILNALDVAPYDARKGGVDRHGDGIPDFGYADLNRNGIPDHVDWRLDPKRHEASDAALQEALLTRYKILLVARDAPFSATLARAIADALATVFASYYARESYMPTLRTIASESQVLLEPEDDDETYAMAMPESGSLAFYTPGLEATPVVQLGLVVHEIAHAYQAALDHARMPRDLRVQPMLHPRFWSEVAPFGWTVRITANTQTAPLRWVMPAFDEFSPEFLLGGKPAADWDAYLEARGIGERPDASWYRERHLVSRYGLSDPMEWHADSLMAYLFFELDLDVKRRFGPRVGAAMMAAAERQLVAVWPDFRYEHLAGSPFLDYARAKFPLTSVALRRLAERYLSLP